MTKNKVGKSKTKNKIVGFHQTHIDLFAAVLIVSLIINLFVLVGWVTLQVTDAYDDQVKSFLFKR